MIVRIITLFAALGLLAACETAPNTSGDADGTGASSSTASSSTASSSADSGSGSSSEQMTISDELIQIGDRVLFGFDSYELTSDAKSILDNQASFLASNHLYASPLKVIAMNAGHANITLLLAKAGHLQPVIISLHRV